MAALIPSTSTVSNSSDDLPPQLDPAITTKRNKGRQPDAKIKVTTRQATDKQTPEAGSIPSATLTEISTQVNCQRQSISELSAAVTQLTAQLGNMRSPSRVNPGHLVELEDGFDSGSDEDGNTIENLFDGLYESANAMPDGLPEEPDLHANIEALLNSTEDPPEYADALPEEVATSFNRLPVKELKPEALKRLKDDYQVPVNAKLLGAPRINPEIWARLNPVTRTKDGQLQYTQQLISRSLVAHARMAAAIRQSVLESPLCMPKELTKNLFAFIMDSATSLGAAQRDLNMKRRAELKPRLGDLSMLCSSRVPVTEMLFGDNLEMDIKTARATSRLVHTGSASSNLKRDYASRGSFSGGSNQGPQFKKPRYTQPLNSGRGQTRFRPSGFRQQYSRSFEEKRFQNKPSK